MSPRFKPLSQHDMTLDQQRVAQAVAGGPRGGLRGPFHALLRIPELADRLRHLGDYVRFESALPATLSADESLAYDFITELLTDKDVSDATFDAAMARFGERTIIELIGTAGYYGFIALVLNANRTPVPEGGRPLPAL